jgi:hypothetical protein
MTSKNPLKLDFSSFIKKLENLPVTKKRELDIILSDLHDYFYKTNDYFADLPDIIETLTKEKAEEMIKDLTELNREVGLIMDVIYDIDIESKPMDRVEFALGSLEDEIPDLIESLKEKIKT